MVFDDVVKFVQQRFTDGLTLVVGSGLSCAEGMPDMKALADHLAQAATELSDGDAKVWGKISASLAEGLESALQAAGEQLPSSLQSWICKRTRELLLPAERAILSEVVQGTKTLRLTRLLSKVLKPTDGIPIVTPNYDRLIEVACERAGFHVDTMAIGLYAGDFDPQRSCMASCRGIKSHGKAQYLDHFPRAIVLKPHGSLDWYEQSGGALRCSVDLAVEPLMITPGANKYKDGYNIPFDKHREFANNYIDRAPQLLIVGYGFNDDHLQTHLHKRVMDGVPTLIVTRTASSAARTLIAQAPNCLCLMKPAHSSGITVLTRDGDVSQPGPDLWDLGVLVQEVLQ